MATNLYEMLSLTKDCTPDQIRKAYRRKALETHPDRLPKGASAADKTASEDMFRKVNNAYEVLSDSKNRETYDQYGIWPPPTPQETYAQGNWQTPDLFQDTFFQDPFSRHPFHSTTQQADPFGFFAPPRHPRSSGFTDPFVLFNHIFGDLHQAFSRDPFGDPFGLGDDVFFGRGFMSPTSTLRFGSSPFGFLTGPNVNTYGSSSRGRSPGGQNASRWISESYTTSTVNGVTYTKAVRRDAEGSEHVTFSYPDGTERRLINGVEQPSQLSIRSPSHHNNHTIAPSQGPSSYDPHSAPQPVAGSRHTALREYNHRSRDYPWQPRDPYSKHDYYSSQREAPYASPYAGPNSSGHHRGDDEARELRDGSPWRFWK